MYSQYNMHGRFAEKPMHIFRSRVRLRNGFVAPPNEGESSCGNEEEERRRKAGCPQQTYYYNTTVVRVQWYRTLK